MLHPVHYHYLHCQYYLQYQYYLHYQNYQYYLNYQYNLYINNQINGASPLPVLHPVHFRSNHWLSEQINRFQRTFGVTSGPLWVKALSNKIKSFQTIYSTTFGPLHPVHFRSNQGLSDQINGFWSTSGATSGLHLVKYEFPIKLTACCPLPIPHPV